MQAVPRTCRAGGRIGSCRGPAWFRCEKSIRRQPVGGRLFHVSAGADDLVLKLGNANSQLLLRIAVQAFAGEAACHVAAGSGAIVVVHLAMPILGLIGLLSTGAAASHPVNRRVIHKHPGKCGIDSPL